MAKTDGFYQQDPEVQQQFLAHFGKAAPYFWAAENGDIQFEGPAAGFLNMKPQEQAFWYETHGEDAPLVWAQQHAANQAAAGGQQQPAQPAAPVAQTVLGGKYKGDYGGQTVRKGDPGREGIGFGQTVAPSTWNPASKGRSEGWGTIGAGTAGIEYGYGSSGFNKPLIKINEGDLPYLSDASPGMAPGYIPGSGTYNQYDLSEENQKPRFEGSPTGLFQEIGPNKTVLNSRYGLGGTGDPTTGGEVQTPQRWITGNMSDSGTAEQGDAKWRQTGGQYRGGGGEIAPMQGGYLQQQYQEVGTGGGGQAVGGGGEGSFFGSTVTSNWGQTAETAGKDYIATLFLRSDTPTGIGTPAWSAPAAFWEGLIQEIKAGRIYVKNADAWKMLAEKNPSWTPQGIGGAATGGNNVPPTGGAGGTGSGAPNQQWGGTLPEGTETPLGPITGGLPGGFGVEWQKLLLQLQKQESDKAIEEAKLTGKFNGLDTIQAKTLEEQIRHQKAQDVVAQLAENRAMQEQLFSEAYRNATLKQNQQKIEGDINYQKEQIRVKELEIAEAARTGDKDREQREKESLREMEQKLSEMMGFYQGQATLEMQKFLAEQQQAAYERAANPAKAFENELARGATGWNQPMVDPNAAGIPGMTQPGQTPMQFMQAGGFAQTAQPQTGPQQPGGYGYGTYPQPVYGQGAQDYAGAQQNAAAAAGMQGAPAQAQAPAANPFAGGYGAGAGAPDIQMGGVPTPGMTATGQAPAAAAPNPAEQQQPAAAGAGAGYGADPAQQQQPATGGGAFPGYGGGVGGGYTLGSNPFASAYGAGDPNAGVTGQNASAQGALDQTMVRTPGAVEAFKAGQGMGSTGQYGYASQLQTAGNALIDPNQVRMQNLKATRKMSPVARGVVQSFAAAGGTGKDTFDFYADKKAPGSSTQGSSYSMR